MSKLHFLFIALCALVGSCSDQHATTSASVPPAAKPEIALFAAASLRDVLNEIAPKLEERLGAKVVMNLGSSGDLSRQIIAGGKADVFVSADEKEMDRVEQAGLVAAGSRRDLLSNALAVIEPIDPKQPGFSLFSAPFAPSQLALAGVTRLALADTATVPAGRYAKAWLESKSAWKDVEARVLPCVDVRATLAAVEAGSAQAGIVYTTDVVHSKKARVVYAVPTAEGPHIVYPAAVLTHGANADGGRALFALLTADDMRATFEHSGFGWITAPK